MKELVLVGAEHAHLKVLRAFAREPLAATRVTLVHPHAVTVLPAMVPALMSGRLRHDEVRISVAGLAREARVRVIEAAPVEFKADQHSLRLDNGQTLSYDVISLDGGLALPRETLPGARRHALFARPFERFLTLWESTVELAQRRSLNVVVIGSGVQGCEMALAAAQRLGARARIALVQSRDGLLGELPPRAGEVMARLLRRAGITLFQGRCLGISTNHVLLAGGARLACDLPLLAEWGKDVALAPWLEESGLAVDATGRLLVHSSLQSTSHESVFAVGPIASRGEGAATAIPMLAEDAGAAAGDVLGLNLRRLTAGGDLLRWNGRHSAQFVDCGQGRALCAWGGMVFHGRSMRHLKRHRDSRAWVELQTREPVEWPNTARSALGSVDLEVLQTEGDHDR